jgi:hypothetical protein
MLLLGGGDAEEKGGKGPKEKSLIASNSHGGTKSWDAAAEDDLAEAHDDDKEVGGANKLPSKSSKSKSGLGTTSHPASSTIRGRDGTEMEVTFVPGNCPSDEFGNAFISPGDIGTWRGGRGQFC